MYKTNLRIHIAFVGFEVDRIVLPAKERRADKVYLMVDDNSVRDKSLRFIDKAKTILEESRIEYELVHHDRLSLFNIIKTVRIVIENEKNNIVYVNLASGSKMQAIGGMMASMMFNEQDNVVPFYVEAKKYAESNAAGDIPELSKGIKKIMDIPSYEIQKPSDRLIKALKIVYDRAKTQNGSSSRISKKDMAQQCILAGAIEGSPDSIAHAEFASMDKNIIQPLKNNWKFITETKIGRTRYIEITDDGKNAAQFLVLDDNDISDSIHN